ncbi:IclR family transcriptional regulator [Rhodococcus qingshengii BKS 20-40]|nr:IclR family transcriptional regulator [Rhodococcus qingshengii BKS 20-40]
MVCAAAAIRGHEDPVDSIVLCGVSGIVQFERIAPLVV